MSGIKRKKTRISNIQNGLEIAFKSGFRRVIIKSDENGRYVGVYYITPNGEFLKNINDVVDWININEEKTELIRSNFNFISKKVTDDEENEFCIDQNKLPSELVDYMLEKKRSIAPGIIEIDEDSYRNLPESCNIEPKEKKCKSDYVILKTIETKWENNEMITENNEIITDNNEIISENNEIITENNEIITENNEIITENNEMITENNEIISENNEIISENNEMITENNEIISENNEIISENNEIVSENNEIISENTEIVSENKENISENNEMIPEKNKIISENKEMISENKEIMSENKENISENNEMILENNNIQEKIEAVLENNESMQKNVKDSLTKNGILPENDTENDYDLLGSYEIMPKNNISEKEIVSEHIKSKNENNDALPKSNGVSLENNDGFGEIRSGTEQKVEIPLENLVLKPVKAYEFPITPMSQQYIFETGNMCYVDKLSDHSNLELHEVTKEFRQYCNNSCAFDYNGTPRLSFECDICLVLWHTDCIGYRWINIEGIKLIICDNCFLLQKTIDLQFPNIFCDIEKLYLQETNLDKNTDNRIQTKLEPILKLYKFQIMMQKHSLQNNAKKQKTVKKISKKEFEGFNNKKCKLFYQIQINQENILHDLKEEVIRIKYKLENIDRLSKLFADTDCRLRLDEGTYEIFQSRITIKKGEIFIPVKGRILKPCSAIFYTLDNGQDETDFYRFRCEQFKNTLIDSYTKSQSSSQPTDGKLLKLFKESAVRPIQLTPIVPKFGSGNRFKIIAGPIILPRSNSVINSSNVKSNTTQGTNQIPNFIKLRQRKQDFGNQKCLMQAHNYMRNKQFHLLNLPFSVLERILSSRLLSTQDKLNCRVACRILKCIIDGSQVWGKLVINPNSITGLENMLKYFRTKYIKKITFYIDFQESFGMEFLLSLISRLKMYPEFMSLDKLSIKFIGSVNIQSPSQLSIPDILSSCKTLKNLSISSENPFALAMSKKKLSSNSLEKLKLKNIQNIYYIIQTNAQLTPNLRRLLCGDWSFVTNIESMSLNQITNMEMYISHSISMSDMSGLSALTSLEILTIKRPLINDDLLNLLSCFSQLKRLHKLMLSTLVPNKNQHDACHKLSCCLPKTIAKIIWKIELEAGSKNIERNYIKTLAGEIQDNLTNNVQLIYFS